MASNVESIYFMMSLWKTVETSTMSTEMEVQNTQGDQVEQMPVVYTLDASRQTFSCLNLSLDVVFF